MKIILKIITTFILIVNLSTDCAKEISMCDVYKLIKTNKNKKVELDGIEFTKIAGFGPTSSTIERKHYFWNECYKITHTRNEQSWNVKINDKSRPTALGTATIFCLPVMICLFSAMYRKHTVNAA
jgi:hypothetical protein